MPFLAPVVAAVTSSAIGSFIVRLAITYVVGRIQQKRMESKMREMQAAQKAQASAVLVNASSNSDPIPVVYGKTRMGGTRIFVESTDGAGDTAATEYLNMIIVMCEGEMNQINKLYYDDTVVWDSADGGTMNGNRLQNFKAGTEYTDILNDAGTKITFNTGNDNQNTDAYLNTSIGTQWGSAHRLRGLTYLGIIIKASADAYKGGLPLITAEIQGKLLQPVNTITQGQTTRTLSNSGFDVNPVDVLYDYLTNPRYGKGLDHTSQSATNPTAGYSAGLHIDLDSFKTARNDVAGYFKINGVVQTSDQIYNNVGEILESMNGVLIFQNGKYKLRIKQAGEASVKTFTYDDIISPVAYQMPGKQNKFNKMKADFRNRETGTDYNDDIVVVSNGTYLAEDNDQILEGRIRLDLVDDETLVSAIATYQMNESRYNGVVEFETAHTSLKVECGDIITLALEDFGWEAGKLFRVAQISITGDDTIKYVAQEYESSIQLI